MRSGWRVITDLGLGVLRARGADAVSFLQGQLSNDANGIERGRLQLSGYHTPQGRAIALLRLTALAADDLLAVLPRDLLPIVVAKLKRYVLRAKVQLSDDSQQWQIRGYRGPAPVVPEGALCLAYGGARQLLLIPAGSALSAADEAPSGTAADWAACDIAEGLPQIYAATSEAFVAQMLNLDVTGGIALEKGCYTGQEIIARTQHRGRIKRRMFRLQLPAGSWAVGQALQLADGRAGKLVEVASDGERIEALAVLTLEPGAAEAAEDAAGPAGAGRLPHAGGLTHALELPLPYSLQAETAAG
jgi:tRNA-modifying protein YgfZ